MNSPLEVRAGRESCVMYDIGWRGFEKFLDEIGNRRLRVTYDRGNLETQLPLSMRERYRRVIVMLFGKLALEIESLRIVSLGSTTLCREDLDCGIEPDECYYKTSPVEIRGIEPLDLTCNPPPDLAVEVDITHNVLDRMGVYASLGVPELWRIDGANLEVYRLDATRQYHRHEGSVFFPFLPLREVVEVVQLGVGILEEGQLMRSLGKWVRTRVQPLWEAHRKQSLGGES
jgi:Uma2 family endonuclease